MIGKLSGTLDSRGADWAIIDVHGVGYVVHCSARTLDALPAPGELTAIGFQFNQPLLTWGTFDATILGEPFSVNGTWGGCGTPIGGPWTGSAI